MLINKLLLATAALYSLAPAVRGQGVPGKASLVAPKGAEVLTVGVIGGTVDIPAQDRV